MGGTEGTVLGVVIAGISVIGSVLVARMSVPKGPAPATSEPAAAAEDNDNRGPVALEVSPEIWRDFNQRVVTLEAEVRQLKGKADEYVGRISGLERLLRLSMRLLRRAHQQLRRAGLEPEPVPVELRPFSID